MAVGRPGADVVDLDVDAAGLLGTRDDALREGPLEHLRKERDDVDPQRLGGHSSPSSGVATIRPSPTSIALMTEAIIGRSSSLPSASTTSTSAPPARMRFRTRPSARPSGVTTSSPTRSRHRYAPGAAFSRAAAAVTVRNLSF